LIEGSIMPIPTQRRGRKAGAAESNTLIFGDPKIGKTTLLAQMENALILDTENGTGFVDAFVMPVPDYPSFLAGCKEVAEQPHDHSPICIDTLDNVVRFCTAEVCRQNGVKDLADLPYGKGYSQLGNGLIQILTRLASLGRGLWMTAHVKEVEVDVPGVGKALRAEPSLPGSVARQLLAFCDFVFYLHAAEEPGPDGGPPIARRVIETKPSRRWIAGDRTGKLPERLPCELAVIDRAFKLATRPDATVPE
jgi:hypothetical protein